MSREDLHADLLADLAPREVPAPEPSIEPDPLPPEPLAGTPTVSFDVTPLKWSLPRVIRSSDGVGKALRLGPLKVELSVKDD